MKIYYFCKTDNDGNVAEVRYGPVPVAQPWIRVDGPVSAETHYQHGNEVREYTSEQRIAKASGGAPGLTWHNGVMAWVDLRPLEEVKLEAREKLVAQFRTKSVHLASGYTEMERASWESQRNEALAWRQDKTAATPFVDAVANARGIARELLLEKVLAKSAQYQASFANLLGEKQRLEDEIDAAEHAYELKEIGWVNYGG